MEHVAGSQLRLSLFVVFPISTQKITIATDNLFLIRVPDNQLLIAILAGVKLVDIHRLACSATSLTEYDLTQASNLLHHVGSVMSRDDIDFVVALVG